jgi:hypothetical protein
MEELSEEAVGLRSKPSLMTTARWMKRDSWSICGHGTAWTFLLA